MTTINIDLYHGLYEHFWQLQKQFRQNKIINICGSGHKPNFLAPNRQPYNISLLLLPLFLKTTFLSFCQDFLKLQFCWGFLILLQIPLNKNVKSSYIVMWLCQPVAVINQQNALSSAPLISTVQYLLYKEIFIKNLKKIKIKNKIKKIKY